ncbi:MAG: hypothetical protein K2Y22_17160 [Candidatus Obscuribacterales bacterium]|nr:hypothetical protein [Candidatus Obscuribacterales bacterium]
MKAKMPRKAPEKATYLCIWCDCEFKYTNGPLTCPICGNARHDDLIPIYVENNPGDDLLTGKDEWHGG